MKAFVVFAAIIAVAAAGAVRSTGWGAPPSPTIDLELASAAAAVGSGSANAGQQLLELVSGNAQAPAILSSESGVVASVSQGLDITELAIANIPSGETLTVNAVDANNDAYAADGLEATLDGANAVSVQNTGESAAEGEGAIAAEAVSINNVQQRKH